MSLYYIRQALLFVILFFVVFFTAFFIFNKTISAQKATDNTENVQSSMSSSENVNTDGSFTLRIYKSSIGVYRDGDSLPFRVIDTDIRTLPELDVEMLNTGIKVDSVKELNRLIQDYES